jgi:hypothetical protein
MVCAQRFPPRPLCGIVQAKPQPGACGRDRCRGWVRRAACGPLSEVQAELTGALTLALTPGAGATPVAGKLPGAWREKD